MKVSSVSGKLNSSYIYFKSNSNIKGLTSNSTEEYLYDIPSKFNVIIQETNGIKIISGHCGDKKYYINLYSGDKTYLSGKIGQNPLYISIVKNKGFFKNKTRINGTIGNKNIDLKCKTNYASQYLKGKYGKDDIDITLWESIMYDDTYIDGEKISMTINNETESIFGKTSLPENLLPVLTGLSIIKDSL